MLAIVVAICYNSCKLINKQIGKSNMQKFGFTVINFNTLLIVNCATAEQRYANNVTLPSLYTVTQKQLAKLFKTAR